MPITQAIGISDLVRSYDMKITEYTSIDYEGNEVLNVCLDDEQGNLQWMPKSVYNEMIAKQDEASTL